MAAPRKYPDELRERATRLAIEARRDPQGARWGDQADCWSVGVHPEALRVWVKQAETADGVGSGSAVGVDSTESARVAELEREARELRRAN